MVSVCSSRNSASPHALWGRQGISGAAMGPMGQLWGSYGVWAVAMVPYGVYGAAIGSMGQL